MKKYFALAVLNSLFKVPAGSGVQSLIGGRNIFLKFILILVVFGGMWQGARAQTGLQDTSDVIWSKQINSYGFNAVKFSPDNKSLAVATFDETNTIPKIVFLDTAEGKFIKEFIGHKASIMSIDFSPDGLMIASGSQDTSIRIWNLETNSTKKVLFKDYPDKRYIGVNEIKFSSENKI